MMIIPSGLMPRHSIPGNQVVIMAFHLRLPGSPDETPPMLQAGPSPGSFSAWTGCTRLRARPPMAMRRMMCPGKCFTAS